MSGTGAEMDVAGTGRPLWVSPWERDQRRRAILDAALRFAAKYGVETLTLGAVADEAGIARGTIYGYFTGRRDLLAQMPAPQIPSAPATDKARAAPDSAEERAEEPPREEAGDIERLAKRILIPKALLKGGTDSAIASLETRLSVIEKSLAEGERQSERAAKETSARIDEVAASVEDIRKQAARFEREQQWALAELKLEIHNLANPKPAEPMRPAANPLRESPVAASPVEAASSPTAEAKPETYLSAARRSAKDAAARMSARMRRGAFKRRRLRIWLAGALAILAAIFATGVYLRASGTQQAHADTAPSRAAGKADARAELIGGLRLLNGIGRPIDLDAGVRLVARAAMDRDPLAEETLANLFRTGTGVRTDMAKAVGWYRAAARQGNVAAMSQLGKAFAGGWPGNTDYARAARWLAAAARYGDIDAAFDLAVLTERGAGVPQSTANAFVWYSIAAKEGDAAAASRADVLKSELTAGELAAGRASAASFMPQVPNATANALPKI